MSLILDGTNGISDVDGTAAAPALTGTDSNTGIFFPAADTIAFSEGGAEAMRIDSSGRVGIGTTSPTGFLNVDGTGGDALPATSGSTQSAGLITRLQQGGAIGSVMDIGGNGGTGSWIQVTEASNLATNYNLLLNPNGGNLLVGTTSVLGASAAGTTHINGGTNNSEEAPLYLRNPFSTAGRYWKVGPTNNGGFIIFNASATGQYMTYGATAWSATSDERLKTAIVPFENAANKVSSLRAGTGRYLTDSEAVSRSFLSAQSVLAVLPEAVDEQEDEIKTLGLRYTDVIPLLVAAIQEQQTLITALTTRITALEGAA